MRICLVSHQYLPEHRAGAEIYAHRLARSLEDHGHEVLVFATKKDLARREGTVLEQEFEGVRNLRVVRNLFYKDFRETFLDPLPGRRFGEHVLEGFRPDIVHVHHLMHHSLELPRLAQARGIPVLMTLHDYWLACPRFGQLRDHEGEICETVDLERCSACLTRFSWRNPDALRWVGRGLEWIRRASGVDLQEPLQARYRKWVGSKEPRGEALPDPQLETRLRERKESVRDLLLPAVDRFLCPSQFLMRQMETFGFPANKLRHQPYGVPFPDERETGGETSTRTGDPRHPLRVAYMGSVLPHKGVHLLLDAYEILRERGVGVDLAIHGGSASNPAYGQELQTRAARLGVRFTGSYLPEKIDEHLAGADLCVVPSLWFENQPITILDARVRGIPSLVSDFGGMAELMPDPRLRFALGDAADLARRLEYLALHGVENLDMGDLPPNPMQDLQKTLEEYASICR